MLPIIPQISHIHSPLRGVTWVLCDNGTYVVFQSTPPCGGDKEQMLSGPDGLDFNPRPHAGATPSKMPNLKEVQISIHAPLRGRCIRSGCCAMASGYFNPRPHAGATCRPFLFFHIGPISIHAPMRGRQSKWVSYYRYVLFQSTPPCGGDIIVRMTDGGELLFQSTPPCGGDLQSYGFSPAQLISIHAPMRGRLQAKPFFH